MFIVKINSRCVQVTQDEKIVTVQRLGHPSDVRLALAAVDCAVEALRGALSEVVRASARHHREVTVPTVAHNLEVTDGFHR